MNQNERAFRKTCGSIGIAMLIFLLAINLLGIMLQFLLAFLWIPGIPLRVANIVYQTVYAAGYLTSFMLPAVILKLLIRKRVGRYMPMWTKWKVSPTWLLAIPAAIAMVFSAAYINAQLVDMLNFFSTPMVMDQTTQAATPETYEWILQFMVVCVVPGFCEEFLFRGAILTNLLPFGRSNAILISAFLFGIMHQNPSQIFYAFAAGVVLGVLYERTGSIWPGTIVHLLNNFTSLSESIIPYRIGNIYIAYTMITIFEALIAFVGIICLCVLIARFFSKKRNFSKGVFGNAETSLYLEPACSIENGRALGLFLTPTMLVFLAIAAGEILSMLVIGGLL